MKEILRKIISGIIVSTIAWFCFASATATLATAIHRNITGGFLGFFPEVGIYFYAGFTFALWWKLK